MSCSESRFKAGRPPRTVKKPRTNRENLRGLFNPPYTGVPPFKAIWSHFAAIVATPRTFFDFSRTKTGK